MDHWPIHLSSSSINSIHSYRSRVLTSTSGNSQRFAANTKDYLNFSKPLLKSSRAVSEPQFPPQAATLQSEHHHEHSDQLAAKTERCASHRLMRLWRDRPHLEHPEYKNYRGRKRKDKGKDDQAIWPDHIEDSFQDALLMIPPMGKSRRVQCGRRFGRNELITEWILQDTGELRTRKQVSSHLQVLNNKLRDDPEWHALTKKEPGDDNSSSRDKGTEFYRESIADQVRLLRQLNAKAKVQDYGEDPWLVRASSGSQLQSLRFDMWVCIPDKINVALHDYTRTVQSLSASAPVPLEDYKNWRDLFPDLEPLLHNSADNSFEIIFLKSKLHLMSEFPPSTSKLSLVLDLDFRDSAQETKKRNFVDSRYFSSINSMYHHGNQFRRTEHLDCHVPEPGIIKPFFEAEWWATQFTDLTRKRKEAEMRAGDSNSATGDDYSRSLFRGLTIMQEIFASPFPGEISAGNKKRVAVLLWAFAQTSQKGSAQTIWQKVVPPPNRQTTNSPAPQFDSSLPPLVMDTTIDSSFGTDFDFSQPSGLAPLPMSPTIYDASSYHSGFTPAQPTSLNFNLSTGFTPLPQAYSKPQGVKQEEMDAAGVLTYMPLFHPPAQVLYSNDSNSGVFDLPSQIGCANAEGDFAAPYITVPPSSVEYLNSRHRTIANFDMSTHQMLQAQLGDNNESFEILSNNEHCDTNTFDQSMSEAGRLLKSESDIYADDEFVLLGPESQQSVTGHMNDLDLDGESNTHEMLVAGPSTGQMVLDGDEQHQISFAEAHPAAFHSPKVTRPPLISHHSFVGILHATSPNNHEPTDLTLDTPTREKLTRIMSNHFSAQRNEPDLFTHDYFPQDLNRPQSQPLLPSNDHARQQFDGPICSQGSPDIEIDMIR